MILCVPLLFQDKLTKKSVISCLFRQLLFIVWSCCIDMLLQCIFSYQKRNDMWNIVRRFSFLGTGPVRWVCRGRERYKSVVGGLEFFFGRCSIWICSSLQSVVIFLSPDARIIYDHGYHFSSSTYHSWSY